jgi:hypothetical protein
MKRFENGSFLIDRMGAQGVLDQDLAVVLLHFRQRLIDDYGGGPAAMMLIDRAVAAYQDFVRIEGWIGNAALLIEHEFFGIKGPSTHFQDRYGREGRKTVAASPSSSISLGCARACSPWPSAAAERCVRHSRRWRRSTRLRAGRSSDRSRSRSRSSSPAVRIDRLAPMNEPARAGGEHASRSAQFRRG